MIACPFSFSFTEIGHFFADLLACLLLLLVVVIIIIVGKSDHLLLLIIDSEWRGFPQYKMNPRCKFLSDSITLVTFIHFALVKDAQKEILYNTVKNETSKMLEAILVRK